LSVSGAAHKTIKEQRAERLGQAISDLICSGNVLNVIESYFEHIVGQTEFHTVVLVVFSDVARSCKRNGSLIVTEDLDTTDIHLQLFKKLTNPYKLTDSRVERIEFCLR
ncbi:hypothetical protein EV181_007766, partial [Coemansia sp. RSA 532]